MNPDMKKYFYLLLPFVIFITASCGTGKSVTRTSQDKSLLSTVKKLQKNPSNIELQNKVATLYTEAAKSHLDKIEVYNTLTQVDKWIKIIKEYEALNKLYNTISATSAAKLINAPPYLAEIENAKQTGADEYYRVGLSELDKKDKQSARNAFYAFRKVNEFVPGYKDVRDQLRIAHENAVVKIVINPIRDNTFFYNSMGWNNYGNNYNNDYFQRSLVSDLGGSYSKSSPALFYTDWEARRENIRPDWEVDLTWQFINIPQPQTNHYSRNISRQIEKSRDTSGKVMYQTVTATLHITKRYFTASGDMDLRITDVISGKNITSNRFSDQFNWQEEFATYTGDSRALTGNEYALLNNNNYRVPRDEDIVTELSRRIYPQIKNRIASVVSW